MFPIITKLRINHFRTVFNAGNYWRCSLLPGLMIFFIVRGSFGLFAADGSFLDLLSAPPGTNGSLRNLAALLPAATNVPAPANAPSVDVTNSVETLDDKYKLAVGDRLSFKIIEDGEDPKQLDVTDSGDLEVPYIGRFPGVGKTCRQLSGELKAALEKDYYYQATVIVAVDLKAKSQGIVYLVGPVRSPVPQYIPSDEEFTLSKAILRAGGFLVSADTHHVRVTRKETGQNGAVNKTYIVDVARILENGKTDLDMVLKPGDFIYISERMTWF
jgi:protein involved in polysaccharide export with SLBB domain